MIQAEIVRLGSALTQAAQQDEWQQVHLIDIQISEMLLRHPVLSLAGSDVVALKALQLRHREVMTLCRERLEQLQQKLNMHQQSRTGLQAYSLFNPELEG